MNKRATLLAVAMLFFAAACSKPYSVLDKTEWLNAEHGLHLSIGTDGNATIQNEAAESDPGALTYAVDEEDPTVFVFKMDADGKQVEVMRVQVPGYSPPEEGEDAQRPEIMESLTVDMIGRRSVEFVADTPENRKEFDKQVAFAREQAKKRSIEGAPQDASQYVEVSKKFGENWATYYVLSQEGKPTSDEDKLGMLSRKWNSTNDSFELQAMKAAELADIDGKIKAIGEMSYIALPADIGSNGPWVGLDSSVGYDFERKGFPLTGSLCSDSTAFANENRVSYVVSQEFGAEVCFLPVPDQDVAKQIERIRTEVGSTNAVRGSAFYKLGPVDGNRIMLLPVGTSLEVGDFFLHEDRTPLFTALTWGVERKRE